MRAIIVDDEEPARANLRRLLVAENDCVIVAEAANGLEALTVIHHTPADVVFLDIEMPGLNGFEVVAQLSSLPLIVFVTAYDEYAVQAFEARALDYLLKPLRPARWEQTLQRIRTTLTTARPDYEATLCALLADWQTQRPLPLTKLAVHKGQRTLLLPLREIVFIGIEDTLVFVHSATEKYRSDKTIGELETLLRAAGFFRINRSELINLEHLTEITSWFSGTLKIRLSNGGELEVSRERARQLKKLPGLS